MKVEMKTMLGTVTIELFEKEAPITVENFKNYVEKGFYDGTIFHRVIKDFMVQCGGFDEDFEEKETGKPIKNEADNRLSNEYGTLAMARTGVVDSATAQFFINVKDNDFLNFKDKSQQGFGYCVFGKVIDGMDIIDDITESETGNKKGHSDVPLDNVVIESIKLIEE